MKESSFIPPSSFTSRSKSFGTILVQVMLRFAPPGSFLSLTYFALNIPE
jgi:hypothetical protein